MQDTQSSISKIFNAYILGDATSREEADASIRDALQKVGFNTDIDTDGDGIPNISDDKPFDSNNFDSAKMKEIYSADFTIGDKFRDLIGLNPLDTDGDGVPDSYEIKIGSNPKSIDSDKDGVLDGLEVYKGLNPINADTDGDGVMDGRDAYPFERFRSVLSTDLDTDGDGVGDRYEALLNTNPESIDSDGDGLSDAIDEQPNSPKDYIGNLSQKDLVTTVSKDVSLSIQNPFLGFLSEILSIVFVLFLVIFVYVFTKWWKEINEAIEHYYHHFHDAYGYSDIHGHHEENDIHHVAHEEVHVDGEEKVLHHDLSHVVEHQVAQEEYKLHPRWAIIKSYFGDNGEHKEDMWRMGVLEADSWLDNILIERGYLGADMSARLTGANFKSIQSAWEIHKVRNRIAHEGSAYTLSDRDAKLVFNLCEEVFRDLHVIN
jgi:hypothetical protein